MIKFIAILFATMTLYAPVEIRFNTIGRELPPVNVDFPDAVHIQATELKSNERIPIGPLHELLQGAYGHIIQPEEELIVRFSLMLYDGSMMACTAITSQKPNLHIVYNTESGSVVKSIRMPEIPNEWSYFREKPGEKHEFSPSVQLLDIIESEGFRAYQFYLSYIDTLWVITAECLELEGLDENESFGALLLQYYAPTVSIKTDMLSVLMPTKLGQVIFPSRDDSGLDNIGQTVKYTINAWACTKNDMADHISQIWPEGTYFISLAETCPESTEMRFCIRNNSTQKLHDVYLICKRPNISISVPQGFSMDLTKFLSQILCDPKSVVQFSIAGS